MICILNITIIPHSMSMDRKINAKIDDYLTTFKQNLIDELNKNNNAASNAANASMIQYILNYEHCKIVVEELHKKKRIINHISPEIRCTAKLANGGQCTRKKNCDSEYCGTHVKGLPYGMHNEDEEKREKEEKEKEETVVTVDAWLQDINGIACYVDANSNVYRTEDIINNIPNPTVIRQHLSQS